MSGKPIVDGLSPQRPGCVHQIWDTAYVAPRDRYSYFREGVCQSFLAFTPEVPRGRSITARIDRVPLSTGSAALLNVSPHFTRRTAADVRTMPGDFVALHLHLAGEMHLDYRDEIFVEKKGGMVLYECNQVFDITQQPGSFFSTLALFFERATLNTRIGSNRPIERRVIGHQPLALALADSTGVFARRFAEGSMAELTSLYEACQTLTAALLLQDRDYIEHAASADDAVGAGVLATIKGFLDHNLADPLLSPSMVAARFGISVRYVHKLFQKDSDTFSSYVLGSRLERARLEMLAVSKVELPLATIIHRWGFRDLAGFHRNFKKRYGLAPGQLRAQAGSRGVIGPQG